MRHQLSDRRQVRGFRLFWGTFALLLSCASIATPQSAADSQLQPGTITCVVTDDSGAPIAGATVRWSQQGTSTTIEVGTGADGRFSLSRVPSGPYQLTVASPGFANQTLTGVLSAGETSQLPPIRLTLSVNAISVDVMPIEEIAEREIKQAEQQRVFGVVPNYFVVYAPNAAPLNMRQKFQLSRKAVFDPVEFAFVAGLAGAQLLRNDYSAFGDGASGYGKRYAALYASVFTRNMIGRVLMPSLLKQDPRYFYKGSGSVMSRTGYAIATAVVRKGDNGHWQPNYSGILGSLAAGALTNFYYPAEHRSSKTTLQITVIGLAASATAHLAQEFLFSRVTTRGELPPQPAPSRAIDTP